MPDTKRNERLAILMGWEEVYFTKFHNDGWAAPGSHEFYENLPDFCGDGCAAVKWLLQKLREMAVDGVEISLHWDLVIVRLCTSTQHIRRNGNSLSLALAAAVEAVKGDT